MRDITVAITAASYSGNKGAAAMLQSSIRQLHEIYQENLNINLMSVYPGEDREQVPWDFVKIVPCKPANLLFPWRFFTGCFSGARPSGRSF